MIRTTLVCLVLICTVGCMRIGALPSCANDADCPESTRCETSSGICRAKGAPDAGATPDASAPPDPPAEPVYLSESFYLRDVPAMDVLIVVDDSGSMCEEQAALARSLARVAELLEPASGTPPFDYRIAVVTTDLVNGTPGAFRSSVGRATLTCETGPSTACDGLYDEVSGALTFGPVLSPALVGGEVSSSETLARQLGCLVSAGTSGDGFEKGLEAMRRALSCDGPNAAAFGTCCVDGVYDPGCAPAVSPDFLRPDAILGVLILADEDDCSAPADAPQHARLAICRNGPTEEAWADSTLCHGLSPATCRAYECEGLTPEECHEARCVIRRSDNSNCAWQRDTVLTPVSDYVDFLRSLKRSPEGQLSVVSLTGPRAFVDGFEVSYNQGMPTPVCESEDSTRSRVDATCCPRGDCVGGIQPVCESEAGIAFSGTRYLELSDAFGANGVGCPADPARADACHSICALDTDRFIGEVISQVGGFVPRACLADKPACRAEAAACLAGDRSRVEDLDFEGRMKCPEEDPGGCVDVRVVLAEAPECPSGYGVIPSGPAPNGAAMTVRYAQYVDPDLHRIDSTEAPIEIPDGESGGIERQVNVDLSGPAQRVSVEVDIRHGSRADLVVSLTHGEREVLVYEGEKENEDDLRGTFTLPDFVGDDVAGAWTLTVSDPWPIDSGELRSWALIFELASAQRSIRRRP